jgi:hypothetical protein
MRRTSLCLLALSAFAVSACEDGPTQVYSPSPPGAGDKWNDGKNPGHSDPAYGAFDREFGGADRQNTCTGPVRRAQWAKMINSDIEPPRKLIYQGKETFLDWAGSDRWEGLTITEAEKSLCQPESLGADAAGNVYIAWGDAGELISSYREETLKIDFAQFNIGFQGAVKFKSRPGGRWSQDGVHDYILAVNKQISKDGKPFEFHWLNNAQLANESTELWDAIMYTYEPALAGDGTATNCIAAATCLSRPVGADEAVWGARGVGMYIHVPSFTKPQPIPSTPDYMYMFVVKLLPFSGGAMNLKIDATGPTIQALNLGDRTPKANCNISLGTKYKDFIDNCVAVLSEAERNKIALNKWLGSHTHGDEHYEFSIVGPNFDFQASNLPEFEIVKDGVDPVDNDWVSQFRLDVRANGPVANDMVGSGGNPDEAGSLPGSGAVYREYARIVQADLNQYLPPAKRHTIGDSRCLLPDPIPPGYDIFAWKPEDGCTGMEGFIGPAAPSTTNDPGLKKVSAGVMGQRLGQRTILRPGDPVAIFCADPGTFSHCGGAYDPIGLQDSMFDGSFQRVLQVMGKGNIFNLPPHVRDRRYFFMKWAEAYVKYLRAYGSGGQVKDLSPTQFDQWNPDPDSMVFDEEAAGVERFEYIDRTYATTNRLPVSIEYQALIHSGNQQYVNYRNRFVRAEVAVYRSMQLVKDPNKIGDPANDNVWITNLAGSPVLYNNYYAASATKDAYFCATNIDDDCRDVDKHNHAPLDANGNIKMDRAGKAPLLAKYPGAFGETAFTLGTRHNKVEKKFPKFANVQAEIANFANPYDTTSTNTPFHVLTDWKPVLPNHGLTLPVNGQRNKFIPTATFHIEGETLQMDIDYLPENVSPDGEQETVHIIGVQAGNFLGEVFLCKDPYTGDLLSAHMYSSMGEIIDWVQNHPGSYDNCNIIVRYSPYNNYPRFVSSVANGIILQGNSGSGFGRVHYVTLFTPGL